MIKKTAFALFVFYISMIAFKPQILLAYEFDIETWWINPVDNDGDGFPHQGTLKIQIAESHGSHDVVIQLSYRTSGSSSWIFHSNTTKWFNLSTYVYYQIISGSPFPELTHGQYEWKLEVIENSTSSHTTFYPDETIFETMSEDEEIPTDINFQAQIISTSANSASSVYACDLDGDGDNDVLSEDSYDAIWFENLGSGSFSEKKVIMTFQGYVGDLCAVDLNGDSALDVLAASDSDKLKWCENMGDGIFGSANTLDASKPAGFVYPFDMDEDGDYDVISGVWGFGEHTILWFENDGTGQFGEDSVFTTLTANPKSVHSADIDNDGDLDLISASYDDDKVAWYENFGSGNFGEQKVITTNANAAMCVFACDLNADNFTDILSASSNDNKIAWYENLGNGNFSSQKVITTDANWARSVYAVDLDEDGDLDVLSASWRDDKIAWYENLAGGNFSEQKILTVSADGASAVYAADIDGDGDQDILSASDKDDKIAWYKNLILPIADFNTISTSGVFPLNVAFTDESRGNILSWAWDFGDGETSNKQNPSHIYTNPGEYTVSLTVTGLGGSDTKIKVNYIIANYPTSVKHLTGTIPLEYELYSNYPNPFNPFTNIIFALPKTSEVRISIFNISGKLVETILDSKMQAGYHSVAWNALNLPSGTYFINFRTRDFIKVQKCVLLK